MSVNPKYSPKPGKGDSETLIAEHTALQAMKSAAFKAWCDAVWQYASLVLEAYHDGPIYIPDYWHATPENNRIIESYYRAYTDLCAVYKRLFWHSTLDYCTACKRLIDHTAGDWRCAATPAKKVVIR